MVQAERRTPISSFRADTRNKLITVNKARQQKHFFFATPPRIMRTSYFAFGTLIALISCLTGVSCQRKCLGSHNYCSSWGGMNAVCVDGYCYCTGQDYDYNTCLPDAYGCKIVENSDAALAKPQYNHQQPQTNYSCTPVNSSTQYEVHVLGVYGADNIHRRPPVASDATVNINSQGKSDRPIILVLGSYEPVNWILNLPANITISKVILVAYYVAESYVSGNVNQVQAVERKGWRDSQWRPGYGSDFGGLETANFLKQVYSRFGVVTSFTGTYRANEWSLVVLPSPRGPSTEQSTAPPTPEQSTALPTPVESEIIQELTKLVRQLIEEQHSQEKRITTLERLEENRRRQFQAQSSVCVSMYKTVDKLSGFIIATIMITVIPYAW